MTRKCLGKSMHLVDRATTGFGRNCFSFERSSTIENMLPKIVVCHREIFQEEKSQLQMPTSLPSYFEKLPQSHHRLAWDEAWVNEQSSTLNIFIFLQELFPLPSQVGQVIQEAWLLACLLECFPH